MKYNFITGVVQKVIKILNAKVVKEKEKFLII